MEDKQKTILQLMESQLRDNDDKLTWHTEQIKHFDDKNTYAKVSQSSDRRSLKIELSRLPREVYDEIIAFVKLKIGT